MNRTVRWRQLLLVVGDGALLYGALAAALWLRQRGLVSRAFLAEHALDFTGLFAATLVIWYALGLYDLRRLRDSVGLIQNMLVACGLALACGAAYFYVLLPYLALTPKTHLVLTVLLGHAGGLAWRRLWLWMLRARAFRHIVTVLSRPAVVRELRDELGAHPEFGYVIGAVAGRTPDLVVVDDRWITQRWRECSATLDAALRSRLPIVTLESFYETVFGQILPEHAGDPAWTIEHAIEHASAGYRRVKHALDRVAAVFLLLPLAPLLLAVGAAVRLLDGRPVLYGQRRVGYLGREFTLWKFRSMTAAATGARLRPFTSSSSARARTTALGGLLRRFRLDELPQLWNVLKGEMSFVGTRPEWIAEVEVLERVVPQYHLRHLVRPGITGWAQVNFRATNSPRDSLEKLRYDLYYVKNISFSLDLRILLRTAKRVLLGDAPLGTPRRFATGLQTPGPVRHADLSRLLSAR